METTETGIKLHPTLEQDNADCEDEVSEDLPDFLHIDPGNLPTEAKTSTRLYRRVEIPNDSVLKENTRSLDYHQRLVVNIGVKYAKDVVKARKEGNKTPQAPLLMVHGGAGTEKLIYWHNGPKKFSRKKVTTLSVLVS